MSKPKLSSKTPDAGEYNSLIGTHDSIVSLPRERRYAVVEFRTKGVVLDVASGEHQATMEIVQIEQPASAADEVALVALLDKMFQNRTHLAARPDPNADHDTPLDLSGITPE
jgi:hypothetical protein